MTVGYRDGFGHQDLGNEANHSALADYHVFEMDEMVLLLLAHDVPFDQCKLLLVSVLPEHRFLPPDHEIVLHLSLVVFVEHRADPVVVSDVLAHVLHVFADEVASLDHVVVSLLLELVVLVNYRSYLVPVLHELAQLLLEPLLPSVLL